MKTYLVPLLLLLATIVGLTGCTVPTPTVEAPAATTIPEPRTITHALGATEITGTPERVVTLEWSYTEDLLALGLQPAGVADIAGYQSWVKIPIGNRSQGEFKENSNAVPK